MKEGANVLEDGVLPRPEPSRECRGILPLLPALPPIAPGITACELFRTCGEPEVGVDRPESGLGDGKLTDFGLDLGAGVGPAAADGDAFRIKGLFRNDPVPLTPDMVALLNGRPAGVWLTGTARR